MKRREVVCHLFITTLNLTSQTQDVSQVNNFMFHFHKTGINLSGIFIHTYFLGLINEQLHVQVCPVPSRFGQKILKKL